MIAGYGLPDRLSDAVACAVVEHDPASRGQGVGVDLRAFSVCDLTAHQGGRHRRRSGIELVWSQRVGRGDKAHGRCRCALLCAPHETSGPARFWASTLPDVLGVPRKVRHPYLE